MDAEDQEPPPQQGASAPPEQGRPISGEALFREVFDSASVGIVITELDGAIVEANEAFGLIVGRRPGDLVGMVIHNLFFPADADNVAEAYRDLTAGELMRFRRRRRLAGPDGEPAWTYLAGSAVRDQHGMPTHLITVVEDITELHLLQQEMIGRSLTDELTALPNTNRLNACLEETIERAAPASAVTLCRVDLDGFSVVNEGLGRAVGDRALRAIGGKLGQAFGDRAAMVARTGADEFSVLLADVPATELSALATGLNAELAEPIYLDDHGIAVSACLGIARLPASGLTVERLSRAADVALRTAQRSGPGQWALYDPHTDAARRADQQRAAAMPAAWENGEVIVEYQPLYGLESGRVVGMQALLRWPRLDAGHADCLQLAEQTGLVLSIGSWLLTEACAALAEWTARLGAAAPVLRVDLTRYFAQHPDLIGVLRQAQDRTGISLAALRIGVPRDVLDADHGDALDNVAVLADMGAGVVLLDAGQGTGYLSHVEDLSLRAIEISPSVVVRLAGNGVDSVVGRAIRQEIPLVHGLGATVIVAGVDTEEQATWWRAAGADTCRGEYFAAPVARDEVVDLVTTLTAAR